MEFGANKTPVEVIREGAFGGTYFRDIYSNAEGHGKNLITWKILIRNFIVKIIIRVSINMVLNAEHR